MARIVDKESANLVGKNVRRFRRERKLTQRQLSEKLECLAIYVCRGSICRIEDGVRTVTDMELLGLSRVLEKPIAAFFEGVEI